MTSTAELNSLRDRLDALIEAPTKGRLDDELALRAIVAELEDMEIPDDLLDEVEPAISRLKASLDNPPLRMIAGLGLVAALNGTVATKAAA